MSDLQENKPLTDADIPSVMAQVVADPYWEDVAKFIYPDRTLDEVRQMVLSIKSVRELQCNLMRGNVKKLLDKTHSTVSYTLSPRLRRDEAYLFVSNHRDITLDAIILQCMLIDEGYETSQVIFGTNLLSVPLFKTIGRANKMVAIERGGSPREFYNNLNILSHYMREVITQKGESVWIAQGNGRTKNGNDTTDPAIVKMFAMSSDKPLSEALAELHPVPVTIAYEIEPCDIQKALELAKRRCEGHYEKAKREDFKSVLDGLISGKGHIHLTVGDPIDSEALRGCHNDAHLVAKLFDTHIRQGYHLMPTNYVAHDMRSGAKRYADHYTAADRQHFEQRMHLLEQTLDEHRAEYSSDERVVAMQVLFDIYATPVDNANLL